MFITTTHHLSLSFTFTELVDAVEEGRRKRKEGEAGREGGGEREDKEEERALRSLLRRACPLIRRKGKILHELQVRRERGRERGREGGRKGRREERQRRGKSYITMFEEHCLI